MQSMREYEKKGVAVDRALFDKMALVEERYQVVMDGFKEFDDVRERHSLIAFADAVQDVITHIYKRRGH